jgi:tetratricopeptide (TPR) repeat protein
LQERLLAQLRLDRERTEPAAADEFAKELLMPELRRLGDIRMEQRDPDASRYYLEALQIAQRLRSEPDEQRISAQLAGFYLSQEPPDWNESLYWLTYAAELCRPYDRICQAQIKILQGTSAMAQSQPAGAIEHYQAALSGLLPADPSDERAECELKLALALSANRSDLSETMQHVQSAIAWYTEDQNVYRASRARFAAAKILFDSGENNRASAYAEEAAHGFATLAPHAEKEALAAARFVSGLDIRKAMSN